MFLCSRCEGHAFNNCVCRKCRSVYEALVCVTFTLTVSLWHLWLFTEDSIYHKTMFCIVMSNIPWWLRHNPFRYDLTIKPSVTGGLLLVSGFCCSSVTQLFTCHNPDLQSWNERGSLFKNHLLITKRKKDMKRSYRWGKNVFYPVVTKQKRKIRQLLPNFSAHTRGPGLTYTYHTTLQFIWSLF